MKGAPSQQGGGGSSGGMPAWFGMAQQYSPQMFGGGQGGASPYAQGGAMSGANPYGSVGSGPPSYMGPPRDQPLAPPPGDAAGGAGGVMTPPPPTPPVAQPPPASGLLGGTPDASGSMQYGHMMPPGLMGNTQGAPSPGQWFNRGYGVPGVSPPGVQPPQGGGSNGNMAPQNWMSMYPGLAGLFGGSYG